MTMLFYVAATMASIIIILNHLYRRLYCTRPLLIDWPFLGMLPQLLSNIRHDFLTHVLKQKGGTGEFIGPWFTNMKYLFTSDPMNAHHILVKSFANYAKGPEFRETFDPFGDGILTADFEAWKNMRSLFHSLFKTKSFEMLVEKNLQEKVERSLLPILDHVWRQGTVLDLQNILVRLTFDMTSSIGLGYDPNSLSIEFPHVEVEQAFDEIEQCALYRNFVPISVWKLQRWLQIGAEKRMTKACKVFEQFVYTHIASKRQELTRFNKTVQVYVEDDHPDLLTCVVRQGKGDKFLRDAMFNLFLAGKNTIASALTWFFWLVSTNPLVEAKIVKEIKDTFGGKHKVLGMEEVKKLIYLHCALCEAMRLFPPIPLERKQSIKFDILPSGHHVHPNTNILFSFYAMGRSEEIWGKDCLEFKPERWISEEGGIVFMPSYKFISFNAGPRVCLGKELSLLQMKIVASSVLSNYRIQVVEGHVITVKPSLTLLMEHGLKVKIIKREALIDEEL